MLLTIGCAAQRQVSVARLGEPILLTKSSYNSGEDLSTAPAIRLETCGNMAGSQGLCVGIAIQKRRVRTHLGQNSSSERPLDCPRHPRHSYAMFCDLLVPKHASTYNQGNTPDSCCLVIGNPAILQHHVRRACLASFE